MQRRVLRQASAVIATTRLSSEAVGEAACRAGSGASISHIYNGYDANDLVVTGDDPVARTDRLRLAYVGTLWNLTSVEPVVEAMKQVAATDPDLAAKIELVVAGRRTGEQDAILDRLDGTACRVEREGYVDHHRAISIMQSADALCLLLSDLPDAGRVVPAKTFEYLALRQPILSIAPCGEVGELLSNCPLASSFKPSNVAGIAEWMKQRLCNASLALTSDGRTDASSLADAVADELPFATALTDEASGLRTDSDDWCVERFERRELTRQLADVLDSAAGRTPDNVVVHQEVNIESRELSGAGV